MSLCDHKDYITTFLLLAIYHTLSVQPIKIFNYLPVMQAMCKCNVDTDNNNVNDFCLYLTMLIFM